MNGSAILTSDSVLGLDLSAQLGASMTKTSSLLAGGLQ